MRWLVIAALVLTACAQQGTDPAPASPSLRNTAAPVASQANVGASDLLGSWTVVQSAGLPGLTEVSVFGDRIRLTTAGEPADYPLDDIGAGRFQSGLGPLWVHWLDVSGRTAALGTPDGGMVWIMDRAQVSADRLTAARAVLDWYGYDLSRMEDAT